MVPPPPATDEIVRLERVFPRVNAEDGVALVHRPGDGSRWYLVTKNGTVLTFENREDAEPTVFVDLSGAIAEAPEAGLLDVDFHPDFADNGAVFLSYTAPGPSVFSSRVSRMTSTDGGLTLDPATEKILLEIEQPYGNHNGGDIGFGPDGFLYIGLGDGGSAGDPRGNGQDTQTLLGAMLRIDVDAGDPYGIPPDNPFADGGGRPEIFAWGLRNPWRWSFDRGTGDLWLGDVGQHMWEEVDVIRAGQDYGWNRLEGPDCLGNDTCEIAGTAAPVVQYRNTGTASIIGGHVYRGSELQELGGTYVFSDFYFGTIFGVEAETGELAVLGKGANGVSAWAEGPDAELYAVRYGGGIARLVSGAGPSDPGDDGFPRLLSQTGCVDMGDPRHAAPGTLNYAVNVPFWSDGADKRRFVAIPDGARIEVGPDGDWALPDGTVLVKSFFDGQGPIETRLLVRRGDDWSGYGYAWDEAATEARYVEVHGERTGERAWVFPESRECHGCHTRAAGGSLGLETAQLDRSVGGVGQLDRFAEHGWLDPPPASRTLAPPDDESASVEERARAYLHVNCSPCHRPEGPEGRASIDLRHGTTLADTGLCDAAPRAGDLGITDAQLLVAGRPERSILSARLGATGSAHMPPLGIRSVDPEGTELVDDWIASLTECP